MWDLVARQPQLGEIPEHHLDEYRKYVEGVNKVTLNNWGQIWESNLKENVKRCDFSKHSVYQFKGKHRGETAFLVGAGPSLSKNIQELKGKKGIIFCCSHALKFLLKNDIKPDYVVVLDAKEKTVDWADVGEVSKDLRLIANTDVHPRHFGVWKGPMWFFRGHNQNDEQPLHKKLWGLSQFGDIVVSGGSVMGACYYIADGMGCSRIVFAGMDLSNTGGVAVNYADGSVDDGKAILEDNDGQRKMKRKLGAWGDAFLTADITGRGIFTLGRMHAYKMWFDIRSQERQIEHINATEGGIIGAYPEGNLKSIKQMRLCEVN